MRTIKEEKVYLLEHLNFAEAYEQIGRFSEEFHSRNRINSVLE
jgi:hypothetical protein